MILDDIWTARRRGDDTHIRELHRVLDDFARNHAENAVVVYDA